MKLYFSLLLVMCLTTTALSQPQNYGVPTSAALIRKNSNKIRPKYLTAGSASALTKLRDTGTSPRFFNGMMMGAGFSLVAEDSLKVSYLHADVGIAQLSDNGSPSFSVWSSFVVSGGMGTLWKLKSTREKKINVGVGYSIRSFTMIRSNSQLMNAGFGLDNITSAGFSTGLFFPFERKQGFAKKVGPLTFRGNPRKYLLSTKIHLPLINVSAVPEYAFLTNVVSPEIATFDTYRWGMGGYLVDWETEFTYYLKNANALRLRYRWMAQSTGDEFQVNVAQHTFGFFFMFRFNPMNRHERY